MAINLIGKWWLKKRNFYLRWNLKFSACLLYFTWTFKKLGDYCIFHIYFSLQLQRSRKRIKRKSRSRIRKLMKNVSSLNLADDATEKYLYHMHEWRCWFTQINRVGSIPDEGAIPVENMAWKWRLGMVSNFNILYPCASGIVPVDEKFIASNKCFFTNSYISLLVFE